MVRESNSLIETPSFLECIPLFSYLDEKPVEMLARSSQFQHIKEGAILFLQSDPREFAYIVRSGKISILLSSPDGRDMMLNNMRRGDILANWAF